MMMMNMEHARIVIDTLETHHINHRTLQTEKQNFHQPSSMPRKRQDSTDASYLLNFRSGIPSDLPSTSHTPETRKTHKKAYKKYEAERQERQAREKLSSSFFLHASSAHAFVISRKTKGKANRLSKDDGNDADKVKDWGVVRTVKCFVPATGTGKNEDSSLTTCSICLDDFVAPRITQCGHLFCYPCLLRHFHSSSKGKETTKDLMAKCPCCFHLTSQRDLRSVEFITVHTPSMNPDCPTVMEFRKLYRCRSAGAPFVPASTNGTGKNSKGTIRQRVDPNDFPVATEKDACYSRFNYLDVDSYLDHFLNDMASLHRELENITVMYSNFAGSNAVSCESDKYYVSMALQAVQVEQANAIATAEEERKLQAIFEKQKVEVQVMAEHTRNDKKDEEEGKEEGSELKGETRTNSTHGFRPGTMYANGDSIQFYQATDGQLCFLSGFNINCLSHEFSAKDPVFEAFAKGKDNGSPHSIQVHDIKPPFPDIVKGRVVDVEHLHLTPDVRKRMRCFSHLPLYTDITLVEIDMNGNLTEMTRNLCKKELDKRRKKRQTKRDIEKKAEREAKVKEDRRIEELKMGIQRVDPNDPFFHVASTLEDTNVFDTSDFAQFLPVRNDTSSPKSRQQQVIDGGGNGGGSRDQTSFRSICATNNALPGLDTGNVSFFPSLSSANEAFPSLSSSAARPSTVPSSLNPHPAGSAWTANQRPSSVQGKKSSKGKTSVLFSTGGRRGY